MNTGPQCNPHLASVAVAPLLLVGALGVPEGTSMASGLDAFQAALARLEQPVVDLQLLALQPSPAALQLIEVRSGVDRKRLDRARLYFGSLPGNVSTRVVTLPLGGEQGEASIALVIDDDGRLTDGMLFGTPEFDEDRNGMWQRVVEQFAWAEVEVRDIGDLETGFEAEAFWRELTGKESAEARWTRALFEIRRRMIGNSASYLEFERTTARGEVPSREWFRRNADSFEQLGALGVALEPFVGMEGTRSFRKSATGARRLFLEMASAEGDDRAERISESFSRMQSACFSCHNIRNHELGWGGPLVFPGLEERMADQGVRNDLFRVGMDVWAPMGAEPATQEIADAVQAALLLVGSSE